MADAIITFGKANTMVAPAGAGFPDFQLMAGAAARSEAIAIGMGSVQSTRSAAVGENYVTILPLAACWVAIGANPTAAALASGGTATGTSWYLASGQVRAFSVSPGDKVAVIQV